MTKIDIINGTFEFGMACALLRSVIKLHHDKKVHGWSIWSVVWPTMWGYWNLYYYPSLGQYASLIGGVFVVLTNTVWIILAVRYRHH